MAHCLAGQNGLDRSTIFDEVQYSLIQNIRDNVSN